MKRSEYFVPVNLTTHANVYLYQNDTASAPDKFWANQFDQVKIKHQAMTDKHGLDLDKSLFLASAREGGEDVIDDKTYFAAYWQGRQ